MNGGRGLAWLERRLPGLAQLVPYPRDALRHDAVAGCAVAIVMIPSVLAYSELLGVAPELGLYAALGGMIGYALFAGSRKVIAGPDTTVALLAASTIAPLAGGDPARTAVLAAVLAILTAALLFLAARFDLGDVADLLSKPVLLGYANGAALILVASQLGSLTGIALPRDGFVHELAALARDADRVHVPTLVTGLALIALMLALRAWSPRVPASLAGAAVAIAAAQALDLPSRGVAMLTPLPAGLPVPSLPDVRLADLRALVPGAIALAFLVFAEGIVLARTLAARGRERIDANRELVALGAANLGSALLGGYNVGASTSRSITADASGGRTQVTQWVAVALLLAFVLVLAPAIGRLPRVALAAILIVAAIGLIDIPATRGLARLERRALWVSLAVAAAVLVVGVLPGVLLGIALSILQVVIDTARPRDAVLRRSPADNRFHDLDDDEAGAAPPGVVVYRVYAPLVFANARHVAERLRALVEAADPPVRCLVVDMQAVTHVDVTAAEVLVDLYDALEGAGIDVRIAHANRPLREQLAGWLQHHDIARERFFASSHEAVDDWLRQREKGMENRE
ncbi:MAG TPA: SulP family inorganic anion transporter [Casimicrobiaceae bacterium]|nr:SulP family inorganic anion transporter [Casimicrobiaceae bacterium]